MINRLLGMIYILMKQGTVTAAELSETANAETMSRRPTVARPFLIEKRKINRKARPHWRITQSAMRTRRSVSYNSGVSGGIPPPK